MGMMVALVMAGGALIVAAPVLAFALKGKVDDLIRDNAREQGLKVIQAAADKVEAEFVEVIDEFAARLRRFVEDAGDRLYSQIVEALDRAVAQRKAHAADANVAVRDVSGTRARVAELSARLERIA